LKDERDQFSCVVEIVYDENRGIRHGSLRCSATNFDNDVASSSAAIGLDRNNWYPASTARCSCSVPYAVNAAAGTVRASESMARIRAGVWSNPYPYRASEKTWFVSRQMAFVPKRIAFRAKQVGSEAGQASRVPKHVVSAPEQSALLTKQVCLAVKQTRFGAKQVGFAGTHTGFVIKQTCKVAKPTRVGAGDANILI